MCFAGAPPRIPAPSHPRESAARSTAAAAKKRPRLGRGRSQAHKMKFAHRTLPVSRYRPLKVIFEHKTLCQVCICTKISGRRRQPNGTAANQMAVRKPQPRPISHRACAGTPFWQVFCTFRRSPTAPATKTPSEDLSNPLFAQFARAIESQHPLACRNSRITCQIRALEMTRPHINEIEQRQAPLQPVDARVGVLNQFRRRIDGPEERAILDADESIGLG